MQTGVGWNDLREEVGSGDACGGLTKVSVWLLMNVLDVLQASSVLRSFHVCRLAMSLSSTIMSGGREHLQRSWEE